jgi:hypothetical protein
LPDYPEHARIMVPEFDEKSLKKPSARGEFPPDPGQFAADFWRALAIASTVSICPPLGCIPAIMDGLYAEPCEEGTRMRSDQDRALLIEALWRATDELATGQPTLAEAAVLRARIFDLLGKLGEGPSPALLAATGGSAQELRSVV